MMIAIVIGVLVVVTVSVVWVLRHSMLPPTEKGMKLFAQSRRARKSVGRFFRDREALVKAAPNMTDEQLNAVVEMFFSEDSDLMNMASIAVKAAGRRAEPALVQAFEDRRCVIDALGAEDDWQFEPPVEPISEALAELGNELVIHRMLPLMDRPEEDLRQRAALAMCSVGSDAAAVAVRRVLADPEEYVRSYGAMGVERACSGGRATDEFRRVAFECMFPAAVGEPHRVAFNDAEMIRSLPVVDRARSERELVGSACLRVDNQNLWRVLETIVELDVPVKPESLREMMRTADAAGEEYPWPYVMKACLILMAKQKLPEASERVDGALKSGNETVVDGAAAALCTLHNLPRPGDLWALVGEQNPGGLQLPVRHVMEVMTLESQVCNGGLSQYFFNPYGDNWRVAFDGLVAMGAIRSAEVLEEAAAALGKGVADTGRKKRIDAYAKMSDDREKVLDSLSSELWDDSEKLYARIARYMVRHTAVFRMLKMAARTAADRR